MRPFHPETRGGPTRRDVPRVARRLERTPRGGDDWFGTRGSIDGVPRSFSAVRRLRAQRAGDAPAQRRARRARSRGREGRPVDHAHPPRVPRAFRRPSSRRRARATLRRRRRAPRRASRRGSNLDPGPLVDRGRASPRSAAHRALTDVPGQRRGPDGDDHLDAPAAAHHLRAPTARMRAAADAAGRAATAALALPVGPDASAASESAPLSSDAGSRPWVPTYTVANLYRDGTDRVGPHADRLTSLGPLPIIVGYSLGSTRTFRLRRRWRDDGEDVIVDVPLPHNSACVMLPPCQELWQHEVLRDGASRGNQPRVSLTFRKRDEQWEKRAPACECGRRCVLKTRRGDQPPPAFAAGASDEAEAGAKDARKAGGGSRRGRSRRRPGRVLLHVRQRQRRAVPILPTPRDPRAWVGVPINANRRALR